MKRRRVSRPAARKTYAAKPYSRANTDTLTGGTKDVNPQFMHVTLTGTAASGSVDTKEINMPIIRLPRANRTQIVEILKVFFWLTPDATAAGNVLVTQIVQLLTSDSTAVRTPDDSTVICSSEVYSQDTTIAGNKLFHPIMPLVHDLTDGAGHGVLVGADKLYLLAYKLNNGVALVTECKILYRLKAVPLSEYIGIVQSQT